MDYKGNIELKIRPTKFNIIFENFSFNLETLQSFTYKLKVNPILSKDKLLEIIDNQIGILIQNSTFDDYFNIIRSLNTYGFGININEKSEINIVYSIGLKGKIRNRNINYKQIFKDYEYISVRGGLINEFY